MKALCIWKPTGPFLSYILEIFPNFVTSFHVIFSQYIKHFLWHLLKWLKKIFPYTKKNSPPPQKGPVSEWTGWSGRAVSEMRHAITGRWKRGAPARFLSPTAPCSASWAPAQRPGRSSLRCQSSQERKAGLTCAGPFRAVLWSLQTCLKATKGRNTTSVASAC